MTADRSHPTTGESAEWRELLTNGHRSVRFVRSINRLVPGPPRCKVCNNPFGAFGGRVFKLAGYTPSRKNPNICARCCERLPEGGATVDIGVLFADVRGSTSLGEQMLPAEFAGEMHRFYGQATKVLLAHGAIIDKLSGDGVMALFVRGVAGSEYRAEASEAAIELRAVLQSGEHGQVLPVGIGVHVGEAFTGNVGSGGIIDFTALGDTVNTAARLQGLAAAGEVVFSEVAYNAVRGPKPAARTELVTLRGKQDEFGVRILG